MWIYKLVVFAKQFIAQCLKIYEKSPVCVAAYRARRQFSQIGPFHFIQTHFIAVRGSSQTPSTAQIECIAVKIYVRRTRGLSKVQE
jgi:hypothetical protein